jgi:hypothetical protein
MEWEHRSKCAGKLATRDGKYAEPIGNDFNRDNVSELVKGLHQWSSFLLDHSKLLNGVSEMIRIARNSQIAILIAIMIASAPPFPSAAFAEQTSPRTSHFEWGEMKDNFAVSLSLPKSVAQGQAIEATFALRYDGPGSVSITRNFAYSDYTLRVVDQLGTPIAPRTDTLVGSSYSVGGNRLTLSSGEMQSETVDLAIIYKLPLGKYTFFASRIVSNATGRTLTTVVAPPAKIEVL